MASKLSQLAPRIGVTAAIFAGIFWLLPIGEVWRAMTAVGWGRWTLVVAGFACGHLLAAYKWWGLARTACRELIFSEALRAHLAGLFANIWLPSIVGGDLVRAGWIARRHGLSVPIVAGLADRILDLLALATLAGFGILSLGGTSDKAALGVLATTALLVITGAGGAFIILRLLRLGRLPATLESRGRQIFEVLAALRAAPAGSLRAFALALLVQAGFVGLNYFLGLAMGIEVALAAWFIAWPLAKIAALLPVSLGGLGVREAALASLLLPFAVAPTLAIAESLVWQSVLMAFGLLAGLLAWAGPFRAQSNGPSG
jgi:uncharacterized membrane protein YbhN (UPF0104 family)